MNIRGNIKKSSNLGFKGGEIISIKWDKSKNLLIFINNKNKNK